MENPRHLIVLGATPPVRAYLDEMQIENITYVDGPVDAMDTVLSHQDAVLAYAAGVFGLAVTGQPCRVADASRALMLLGNPPNQAPEFHTMDRQPEFTDDPEALAPHAAAALRTKLVLFLSMPEARQALTAVLTGDENAHIATLVRQ